MTAEQKKIPLSTCLMETNCFNCVFAGSGGKKNEIERPIL